jgi:hypothetical protein
MKIIIVIALAFFQSFFLNAQENEASIKLKKQKSLLQIEKLVNVSLEQSKEVKTENNQILTNKATSNNLVLKKVVYKIDINNESNTLINNEQKDFQRKPTTSTIGKKKLISHTPLKPRLISEKSKLELKKLLGLDK